MMNETMQYVTLGRTGLRTSKVALGTGGRSRFGQDRDEADKAASRLVARAWDLGINLFDTSPAYGESERMLGRALRELGIVDDAVLATKVIPTQAPESPGETPLPKDPAQIAESVEQSLRHLGRETIDILMLHGVDPSVYRSVREHVYPVIVKLRDEGKIRALGISESAHRDVTQEMLGEALRDDLFDVIMARFNLVHQGVRHRLCPAAQRQNVGLMAVCPVEPPLHQPAEMRAWAESWRRAGKVSEQALAEDDPVAGWIGEGPKAMVDSAMRFAAHEPGVGVVVTGTSSPEHLAHNVQAALTGPLDAEAHERLHELYGGLEEGRVWMMQEQ